MISNINRENDDSTTRADKMATTATVCMCVFVCACVCACVHACVRALTGGQRVEEDQQVGEDQGLRDVAHTLLVGRHRVHHLGNKHSSVLGHHSGATVSAGLLKNGSYL